ncbi:MAG: UDP-N-acetylmuramoyl-L-alanyl-D-glutamate--2,6-diaminopimelate ligase [Anaerolineae bacterium]|nr:UDP-N-acetylmuramoyl-L-alanyl-D-glutamate--2,6-diaminopimelate ligase [Anaerolineae bacterium]
MPEINLSTLFHDIDPLSPLPDVHVSGIALDSRLVQPGDVFFAIQDKVDRYQYIDQVIARGAVAVIGEQSSISQPIPHIQVADCRLALAHAAASFYGYPAKKLILIGVTGTDGKTTTANLIYHILNAAGLNAGMISTVNAIIGDQVLDTGFHVTTPEAHDVQRYLAEMVTAGLTHVVLEATSHGLAQRRVLGSQFDLAVVTNITHEHLDYHGSYEGYRDAKGLLFSGLNQVEPKEHAAKPAAILNRDDRSFEHLSAITQARQISYGVHPSAQLRAANIQQSPDGLKFTAIGTGFQVPIECSLVGDYNVSNCLASLGAALALDIDPAVAQAGIAAMPGVPGRMQRIDLGQDFTAIVDFAHTPNAMLRALQAGREISTGRVIAVFGSAGLRDRAKRRMMAETSAEHADLTILTAEDPRTESLDGILSEMAVGAESKGAVEGQTFWRIPDRGQAIHFALSKTQPGDLLLVLGKGHEQSMCFGETEFPWDDRTALKAALAAHLDVDGPDMPYLPTQDE